MQNVVNHLRNVHGSRLRGWGDLNWGNTRMWVDHYDEAAPLALTKEERQAGCRWRSCGSSWSGIATSVLQDDPVELVLKHGQDLEMFVWISEQKDLFL